MKINLTRLEVEAGFQEKRLSKKRIEKLTNAKASLPLFFLSNPTEAHGRFCVAVLCREIIGAPEGMTRVSFEPVSAQAFTVFDAKTKDLNQVTLLTPQGQFTFTSDDTKRTAFSLDGPGVDPDLIEKSWGGLLSIFAETSNAAICRRIVAHLQQTLLIEKKAA